MRQALSDVRVVELGSGVAAGWCGKVFADLGADVTKVEPPEGDTLRADAGMFAHLHTNKRSVVGRDHADRVGRAHRAPRRRRPRDRGARTPRPGRLGPRPRRPDRRAPSVDRARDHRVRAHRPLRGLRVERSRGAGLQRRHRDGSAGPAQAPDVARRDGGRPHCRARRAGRGAASARDGRRSRRGLLRDRSARVRAGACLTSSRVGVRRPRVDADDGAHQQRHAAAARRLPVRRRLRGDDDDDAAAPRDAERARERRAARRLRASRRVHAAGDEGDPRQRPLPLAVRTDARRGDCRRPGGGLAGDPGQRARRAARGGPPPPARVLGPHRRRRTRVVPPPRCAVPVHRGWVDVAANRTASGSARGGHRRTGRRPSHFDTGRGARPRGAAAARDPGARPHDGLVRAVPHCVAG